MLKQEYAQGIDVVYEVNTHLAVLHNGYNTATPTVTQPGTGMQLPHGPGAAASGPESV